MHESCALNEGKHLAASPRPVRAYLIPRAHVAVPVAVGCVPRRPIVVLGHLVSTVGVVGVARVPDSTTGAGATIGRGRTHLVTATGHFFLRSEFVV